MSPRVFNKTAKALIISTLLVAALVLVSGCQMIYLIKVSGTQTAILWNREPLNAVLKDPTVSTKIKTGLQLVARVKDFLKYEGFQLGGSFESYSHIDKKVLSWVVAASPPLKLESKQWWFPIVGSVPYLGFFTLTEAKKELNKLKEQGYEGIVRPVTAFSTLGWFDDPVLTPLLERSEYEIVNTIIHETVHQNIWIKNSVALNESLAHFIALNESSNFFKSKYCTRPLDCQSLYSQSLNYQNEQYRYSQNLESLKLELEQIYNNLNFTYVEKHTKKVELFNKYGLEPNNALLMQELVYHSHFNCFRKNHTGTTISERLNQLASCKEKS